MAEKIVKTDILDQSMNDMRGYAIYVARRRALPDPRDGLKPVHRKLIYALFKDFNRETKQNKTVKTAALVGTVMRKYHPHGDTSINSSIKPLTNWFQSYIPLIDHQGSFGTMSGDGAAAQRYTEVKLSDYGLKCIVGDLVSSETSADWQETYDGEHKEPIYLPSIVPNLLINGAFGIAVAIRTQIPSHNISEVIDMTIKLIKNPNTDVVLVPDDCCGCDIIEADWAKISRTGKGKFKVRAIVEITEFNNHPALKIKALPPSVYLSSVKEKIEQLVQNNIVPQVIEVYDKTEVDKNNVSMDIFEAYIILKKGCDPVYVRDLLYNITSLQTTIPVNLEVVYNETPVHLNYKEYLQTFINFRRERKMRTYTNLLMKARTREHKMKLYITAMESGEIDTILKMIRKQKSIDDDTNINYLVKKLKVTPLQAKFLLDVDIRKLSIGYLDYYKKEYKKAIEDAKEYYKIITHPEAIDDIIIEELKAAKAKYGCPRRSRIISAEEAAGIPEGIFKVIITEKGLIKKIDQNDKIGTMKDDKPYIVMNVDNKDDLIIFGELGKAYKLPVSKVPFSKSNGVDMRKVIKKYTGEGICTIIPLSLLHTIEEDFKKTKQEAFIYVITAGGLFKAMKISEMYNVPLSGLIYAKLNEGDAVADIVCMDIYNQLIIYSCNKILRVKGSEAPILTRTAKGVIAMNSKYPIDGFACLYPKATDVITITTSGRINKLPLSVIPVSSRAKAGNNGIRLGKNDSIYKICVCSSEDILHIVTMRNKYDIVVKDIPNGSSVSTGEKLVDASGIVNISVEHNWK